MAAVAAAAQLGAADALGITRWEPTGASTRDWSTALTWVAFCYAVSVLSGAFVGRLAVRREDWRVGVGARISASLAAALGAAAVVGLAWLPASGAQPPGNVNPGLVVSITAGAGIVGGLILALLALAARPVAVGLQVSIAWLWLTALGCAVAGLVTHQPYPAPRLGVLDAPQLAGSVWNNPRLMVGLAALVGLVVAGFARWRRSGRFGVSLAGFGGPALVATAYLIAGPGTSDDTAQGEPYLTAMVAVGAGLIASVLIAMPGRRSAGQLRPDLNLDDLRPLTGDVVTPPGRPGRRPNYGDDSYGGQPYGDDLPSGDHRSYDDRLNGGNADRPRTGGTDWDADTWPPGRPSRRTGGGWPTDPRGIQPQPQPQPQPQSQPRPQAQAQAQLHQSGWPTDPRGIPPQPQPQPQPPTPAQPQPQPQSKSGGATYRGGTDATSSEHETTGIPTPTPVMGQPVDPHESWLRDLGPSGRHTFGDRDK